MYAARAVAIAPGASRTFVDAEWTDALVIVSRGEIELCGAGGTRRRFARGDLLWLAGVPLSTLHNPGAEPAVLLALSRTLPV